MEEIKVKFFFDSGKELFTTFDKTTFEEHLKELQKNWNDCVSLGPKYGVKFQNVTHFVVMDE